MNKDESPNGVGGLTEKPKEDVVQTQKPLPILVTAEGILGFADEQHNLFVGIVFPSFVG